MSKTHRIIFQDDYTCPYCGGFGSIYKTIKFDKNGKSIPLSMDFKCQDCDQELKINRENQEFLITRSFDVEN